MYNTDGKFWYGREWDWQNYINPDPSFQGKLRVFGTGNLGTVAGQDYGTVDAPVFESEHMAAIVYVQNSNRIFYRQWGSDIIYYSTGQPDINSIALSWSSFNVSASARLSLSGGDATPFGLSTSRSELLLYDVINRYVYFISAVSFTARASVKISPAGTINSAESREVLHTFAYDGSYFYFGGGVSVSSNLISVYRSDVSYDSTTTPVKENFVTTFSGIQACLFFVIPLMLECTITLL